MMYRIDNMNIVEKFINTHELTKEEYVELIRLAESDVQVREQLKEEAVLASKKILWHRCLYPWID